MANPKRYASMLTREQQRIRNSRRLDSAMRSMADGGGFSSPNYAWGVDATKRGRAPYYERRKKYREIRAALGLSAG